MIEEIKEESRYILEMDAQQLRHFSFCIGVACGSLCKEGLTDEALKAYKLQDSVKEIKKEGNLPHAGSHHTNLKLKK